MSVEIVAVWLLLSGYGGRSVEVSAHLTEAACRQAAADLVENSRHFRVHCAEGLRRFDVTPPKPTWIDRGTYRTSPAAVGTCTGDDRFCGRALASGKERP